jgi:membrane protein required for colicin V production
MSEFLSLLRENVLLFDVIFLIFICYFSIQCFAKGFFISLVSLLKWILALVITIILVPKLEPYISDYIRNDYLKGIGLGVAVYILSLFILILLGRSLGRLFSYTGMGSVDKVFGFFFGIFKGYVFVVCIFSILNWFQSYEKWDINLKNSYFFPITEKGSQLLIEEFPSRKNLDDTKKEIEKI